MNQLANFHLWNIRFFMVMAHASCPRGTPLAPGPGPFLLGSAIRWDSEEGTYRDREGPNFQAKREALKGVRSNGSKGLCIWEVRHTYSHHHFVWAWWRVWHHTFLSLGDLGARLNVVLGICMHDHHTPIGVGINITKSLMFYVALFTFLLLRLSKPHQTSIFMICCASWDKGNLRDVR